MVEGTYHVDALRPQFTTTNILVRMGSSATSIGNIIGARRAIALKYYASSLATVRSGRAYSCAQVRRRHGRSLSGGRAEWWGRSTGSFASQAVRTEMNPRHVSSFMVQYEGPDNVDSMTM